jgi:hypothetical protein
MAGTDLAAAWASAGGFSAPIHVLAATDDPLATTGLMASTFAAIYNQNRSLQVALDPVTGKHGFTIANPEYIAKILLS